MSTKRNSPEDLTLLGYRNCFSSFTSGISNFTNRYTNTGRKAPQLYNGDLFKIMKTLKKYKNKKQIKYNEGPVMCENHSTRQRWNNSDKSLELELIRSHACMYKTWGQIIFLVCNYKIKLIFQVRNWCPILYIPTCAWLHVLKRFAIAI